MFTNDFSREIWDTTYRAPEEKTVEDTLKRVAKGLASAEKDKKKWEDKFYNLLLDFKFVPGGRILANIGRDDTSATLYNCFVSAVQDLKIKDPDSIEGIYEMLTRQALTLKSEGGYGVNMSWIRPEGMYVAGIGSRTPGVLKFAELWDKSSEIITAGSVKVLGETEPNEKQKIRKGAQMFVLEVWHPEIMDFIVAKQTPGRLTKFNVSVGVTEGFMEAVKKNKKWDLYFPDTKCPEYKTEWDGNIEKWKEKGLPVKVYKTVKAKEVWELIMRSTYDRAEPGILFIDTTNKLNPINYTENVRTTNPCGEIPMSTGVCCLASMNLTQYVVMPRSCGTPYFDYDRFSKDTETAIRALDNVQDISKTPLPEYSDSVKDKRRIGLGVTGLGSIHYMLGVEYGSDESLALVRKIFQVKCGTELMASALLGSEKGNFKSFDKDKYFNSYWWKNLDLPKNCKKEIEEVGCMRNSHQSMNAPTGNTGIFANNISGGMEPSFNWFFIRWSIVNVRDQAKLGKAGFKYPRVDKGEWFETEHVKFSNRGSEQILRGDFDGQVYEIDKNRGLTKATMIKDYGFEAAMKFYGKEEMTLMQKAGLYKTTDELSVDAHLSVLKVVSHYTNQANSKTINIPNDYPYEDFKKIYENAYDAGIKGVTTYREGTMTAVLEASIEEKKEEEKYTKRQESVPAELHHVTVAKQKYYVAVGILNDTPYEVFTGKNYDDNGEVYIPRPAVKGLITKQKRGKYTFDCEGESYSLTNGHSDPNADALTRIISTSLRHDVDISTLVHQLEKTEGPLISFSKALMRTLKKYIKDGTRVHGVTCDSCKSEKIVRSEGCMKCSDCGWSKCS
jgi:ribonucleoside-diphosphate reductase alpha chain